MNQDLFPERTVILRLPPADSGGRVNGTDLQLARGDGGDRNPGDQVGGRGFWSLPDGIVCVG
jgi:hypothetical protein